MPAKATWSQKEQIVKKWGSPANGLHVVSFSAPYIDNYGAHGDAVAIYRNGILIAEDYIFDGPVECHLDPAGSYFVAVHHGWLPQPEGGDTITAYGFRRDSKGQILDEAPGVLYLPIGHGAFIHAERLSATDFVVRFGGEALPRCRRYCWNPDKGIWRCSHIEWSGDASALASDPCEEEIEAGDAPGRLEGVIRLRSPAADKN
jgi:hypothetical protein